MTKLDDYKEGAVDLAARHMAIELEPWVAPVDMARALAALKPFICMAFDAGAEAARELDAQERKP